MKKKILAALLVAATILSFSGCGKFTCDLCGKEKTGKKYEETVLGATVTICGDCYEKLESLSGLLQ